MSKNCEFPSEGLNEKAFRSFDFAGVQCSIRRDLHAPNLRLLLDGDRYAVFSQVSLGNLFGHPGNNSGASIFRRGHMMLRFDQPVTLSPKNTTDEGKIQPGRGKQIASILMAGGVGIGVKDITDGLSGAVYKSWYAIPISCVTLAFFSNGGDVNLKRGDTLEIVLLRN